MMRLLILFALSSGAFASDGEDLTATWVGVASLIIFVLGYYLIAAEEVYHINKSKPALFIGTFIFMLLGVYYYLNSMNAEPLHDTIESLIAEIAEIVLFLFVAMAYIEALLERRVFDTLKYSLVSKGYSYKKLFWFTGLIAFFLSPIADNLTTALILSTVLVTIENKNVKFLVPGAINIVVAANAGGAWSPFGDITTLMVWTSGKGEFYDFLFLFPAAIIGWFITAYLLSRFVPDSKPAFDVENETKVTILQGGKVIIWLGVFTVFCAVMTDQLFHLPAMWGMMFGLSLLKLYSYRHKRKYNEDIKLIDSMGKIETDTLMFFFGILAAVGGLHFIGYLALAANLYDVAGATAVNISVGFVSAIVDNIPVMSAVLKANPTMGLEQWILVTLTAGIGGSLISFGSAAGVGVMGKLRGIYTFSSHLKYAWTILVGYMVSVGIWYVQYEMLGLYIKH